MLSLGYAIAFLFPTGFTFFLFCSFLAPDIGGAIVLAALLLIPSIPRSRLSTVGNRDSR